MGDEYKDSIDRFCDFFKEERNLYKHDKEEILMRCVSEDIKNIEMESNEKIDTSDKNDVPHNHQKTDKNFVHHARFMTQGRIQGYVHHARLRKDGSLQY